MINSMEVTTLRQLLLFTVALTSQLIGISSETYNVDEEELLPVNYYLSKSEQQIVQYKLVCRGWPCPQFSVDKDWTPFVQERTYDAFATVTITVSGCGNFSDYLLEGYMALFRYRRGQNAEKKSITMSVPVLTEVRPGVSGDNDVCDTTDYTIEFYVNKADKLSVVPKPTEENVTLQVLPNALNVYVKTFVGFVDDFASKWIEMKVDLGKLGLCFSPHRYYIAMYDPPWKKHGRRNELWAIVIPCDVPSKT